MSGQAACGAPGKAPGQEASGAAESDPGLLQAVGWGVLAAQAKQGHSVRVYSEHAGFRDPRAFTISLLMSLS